MNKAVPRTERLNAEFQREISAVIARKLKNPFITEMVSVLNVDVSQDLKHAKVFLSIYSKSPERRETTFSAIKSDAKKIRYELGKTMKIRTVPELTFVLDASMEYGDKMDKLFKKIKSEGSTSD